MIIVLLYKTSCFSDMLAVSCRDLPSLVVGILNQVHSRPPTMIGTGQALYLLLHSMIAGLSGSVELH